MRPRARRAVSPPPAARRLRKKALSPPAPVVERDPDPPADKAPSAAAGRPHLELPRRGEPRAIDLRSVRIFVEPDAILDTIIRRRATGDQPPSGAAGGRQIAAQLAVAGLAIPGRR